MRLRQIGIVWLLVAVGIAVMAVPSLGLYSSGMDTVASVENNEDDEQIEGEFGIQVSSFSQTTATDASETVDAGLWQIRVNASEKPDEAIENRSISLSDRIKRLDERVKQLEERRENLSTAEYTARASALRAQTKHMHSHVEQANRTAFSQGVHSPALDRLRNDAANMTGPEVSELARSITDTPGGPPANAGPTDRAGSADDIDSGPPDDAVGANETDRDSPGGPPEDAAQTNNSDQELPEAPGHGSEAGSDHDQDGDDTAPDIDNANQTTPGEQSETHPDEDAPEDDTDDDNATKDENRGNDPPADRSP